MLIPLPSAAGLRRRCTESDSGARTYARMTADERMRYSIPRGDTWWWCVLPPPGRLVRSAPRVRGVVHHRMIYKVALGFHRGGIVGVVGMR